jgi:nucleoside-diphosphate kinase
VAAERTLVVLKPDAVQRGLIGEILARFERLGLTFERVELRQPSRELVERHYPSDEGWLGVVGGKTLSDYQQLGIDPVSALGTDSPVEIGKMVKSWLVDFMTSGPVLVAVVTGNRAIEVVRKVVGSTLPTSASPGTIRGDYSTDSPDLANSEGRPVRNLVHASGTTNEAEDEISVWFPDSERLAS